MCSAKKQIVVSTRSMEQSAAFESALVKLGFRSFSFPSIEIKHKPLNNQIRETLEMLKKEHFNWIVFTSANAVRALRELQSEYNKEKKEKVGQSIPFAANVAVIGDKTARVFKDTYGRDADLIPKQFIAEALLKTLAALNLRNSNFLLVLGDKNRGVLTPQIKKLAGEVMELIVYENNPLPADSDKIKELEKLAAERLIFTFFSPSAVISTLSMLNGKEHILKTAKIVSIGPITSKALMERGLNVSLEVKDHSQEGILAELCKNFNWKELES